MFTGIIEELGTVRSVEPGRHSVRLDIAASTVVADAQIGDSIAVNGVCLTVVDRDAQGFRVDVIPESIARSSLGNVADGSKVNLERPMQMGGRLDGHLVQGHVDGVGRVRAASRDHNGGFRLEIETPEGLSGYLVEKGSITIDGVSLTISALSQDSFEVALIPHTLTVTTLGDRRPDDIVNLEVDVIAKYVARNMSAYNATEATS